MSERIEKLLEQQNLLLLQILEAIEKGTLRTGKAVGGGKGSKNNLTQQQKDDLEYEIDLNYWFINYGEESLPAKYMCSSVGIPSPNTNPYSKDEGEYIFNRLMDYEDEQNEQGTHKFKYLGKVWSKRESNSRNCFAFIPIKSTV